MTNLLRGLKAIVVAVLLVALPGMSLAAAEEATGLPEAKPVLGVVLLLTDQMRAEKNAKPTELFRGAVNEKVARKTNCVVLNIADADLIAFLSKKDIVPDSVGLLRELKLPLLLEYGKGKNVDILLVVIGDAKVYRHMQAHLSESKDKDGKVTSIHSYETEEVDYADLTLRAAYVDVKKGEYIQNYTVERRSGPPAMFGNGVRSVINDGSGRVLGEFNQKFAL